MRRFLVSLMLMISHQKLIKTLRSILLMILIIRIKITPQEQENFLPSFPQSSDNTREKPMNKKSNWITKDYKLKILMAWPRLTCSPLPILNGNFRLHITPEVEKSKKNNIQPRICFQASNLPSLITLPLIFLQKNSKTSKLFDVSEAKME